MMDDPCDEWTIPLAYSPMINNIQRAVAQEFGIPLREMRSACRARELARPRQVAMYLAKRMTRRSLPEIGRMFGNRDHTTVIHAIRRIEHLRTVDSDLDQRLCRAWQHVEEAA